MSTAYHPQIDRRSKRTIRTLEEVLRACALDDRGRWDERIPLAEIASNNRVYVNIGTAPFEALCNRKRASPLGWHGPGERGVLGSEVIH